MTLKKTIAALLVFLLPGSFCHAAPALSVCFATDGTVVQCSDGKALLGANGTNLPGRPDDAGQKSQNKDFPSPTYANLEEDSLIPSEVLGAGDARDIWVPAYVKAQEPFVSLQQDARQQALWPWRDVVEDGPRKLHYNFSVEDVTGRGNVRVFNTKIGVEYEVAENRAIGVEAIRGIQDSQDAAAWGKSAKEEKTAQVKYKIFF